MYKYGKIIYYLRKDIKKIKEDNTLTKQEKYCAYGNAMAKVLDLSYLILN